MKVLKVMALSASLAIGIFTLPANADSQAQTCKVTDPTGTPLNARATPNGKVVGKVNNGTVVYVAQYDYDDKGRPWALVFNAKNNKYIGWVYREFISCY